MGSYKYVSDKFTNDFWAFLVLLNVKNDSVKDKDHTYKEYNK